MATGDVTVMGAGIMGLSVAYACAKRGARVQVIDPSGIGAGASGGVVGALSPHVPEHWNEKKAFQLDALLMSREWWGEVAAVSGVDPGYARNGRLQPLPDDRSVVLAHERAAGAAQLWRGEAVWEVVAAAEHAHWLPAGPSGFAVRDTLSARINPRKALQAVSGAITALGGRISTEGPMTGPVVWATGYSDLIEAGLGNGEKGQAALLAFDAAERPQLFVDGLHIVPHGDGAVAVGSTSERNWSDATTTDERIDGLIAKARVACPVLADAPVLERWAGIRPRPYSRSPLLGHHPDRPGSYIANGGFKIGFGIAPLVGEVMADLILNAQNRIPADFQA